MSTEKQNNLAFFETKLSELLADPICKDKFVVICKQMIQGVYDTFPTALEFAVKNCPVDEFVIQQVIDQSKIVN